MSQARLPFADWLKAAGLALIVWGHVAAWQSGQWTPPVYPKQLGVALFVFVTGFTLARERRPKLRVVFNRYFEVFFVGVCFAVLMSVVGLLAWADVSESNYLPFLVGANVLLNDFPANPTTWYIGTYLHLLILWAVVLRDLPLTGRMLLLAAIGEILVRAILIGFAGLFPAYMLFSNWLTVLLLGLWAGQHRDRPAGRRALFSAVLFLALYPIIANTFSWRRTFPLMTLSGTSLLDQLTTALFVTTVYVGFTGAAFVLTSRLPHSRMAGFLARNTVFVFIAHMPVYYLLEYLLLPVIQSYPIRVTLEFVICCPVLAVASEAIHRFIPVIQLRDRAWNWRPAIWRIAAGGAR